MEVSSQEARDIIGELRAINARMKRQNSFWHMLWSGLIYGVGFLIGSAILATLIIGILSPWIRNIPGIDAIFLQGKSVIQQH